MGIRATTTCLALKRLPVPWYTPLLEVLGAQGHLRKQTESDKEKSVIEFFEVERTPRSPSPVLSLY